MPEKTLAEKMKLKGKSSAALINASSGYLEQLSVPSDVQISTRLESGLFDWLQIFVQSRVELETLISKLMAALKPVSISWITFPKGSSSIQTDLTRDKGWDSCRPST
jgi:hypothetical protein